MILCEHREACGACSLWELSYAEEERLKRQRLQQLLTEHQLPFCDIEFYSAGYTRVRDRVDLQWRADTGWGFFAKTEKKILPVSKCLLLTENLQKFLTWFGPVRLPIPIASARLRVSPSGQWGVWLDTANIHVKTLLEEQNYLNHLQSKAFVEIGQRRKKLVQINNQLKLQDPEFHEWFCAYDNMGQSLPLYSCVGSFTQVGFKINRLLIENVLKHISLAQGSAFLELGAGVGNFTFPLLSAGYFVLALENDTLALAAMRLNVQKNWSAYSNQLRIEECDFTQVNQGFLENHFANIRDVGLLVDPPRSGLKDFLNYDFWQQKPFAQLIYVSCSLESWAKDAQRLLAYGYQLKKVILVDQFPRSEHIESISIWG